MNVTVLCSAPVRECRAPRVPVCESAPERERLPPFATSKVTSDLHIRQTSQFRQGIVVLVYVGVLQMGTTPQFA
jgi:hypothetical protein